jgi:hypothetical protein
VPRKYRVKVVGVAFHKMYSASHRLLGQNTVGKEDLQRGEVSEEDQEDDGHAGHRTGRAGAGKSGSPVLLLSSEEVLDALGT